MEARLAAAAVAPRGQLAPSGIESLKSALRGNASQFAAWRRDPLTRRVVAALSELLARTPKEFLPDAGLLVQYGFSQGLTLAVQLCNDPSVLWPGVFGETGGEPPALPPADFSTSIDEAFTPEG